MPALTLFSISLILWGAIAILIALRRVYKIVRILRGQTDTRQWTVLISLMSSFILGYCLAIALLIYQAWTWLSLLTGVVFCLGSCFVLFTINLISKTIQQLLATRISQQMYKQSQAETQQALHDLQETQAQLIHAEKMAGLGQLVAGVAHEINNPISFIYGNLSYLETHSADILKILQLYRQAYPNSIPEIEQAIEEVDLEFIQVDLLKILASIQMGTHRIQEIVLSLRNFSRLDEAEFKAVDIHQGIESTLLILQHRLKRIPSRPEILIDRDYADLPEIECLAGQLNQVFMNILSNAIDALEFAAQPQISIQTAIQQDWVKIAIADTGMGISEAIRQKIFDPFFTTKPVGKGTGMGMSISYQIIVEKHQGKLLCSSIEGEGTEFLIQIPIQRRSLR
ncbi:MAG: ATP-binding protein [Leptolyngbya sp. Prado105]|jgi:signal transduction histidine kinase|nr:ATP-binding protein [Leptolyngbya sp. Prado105]